MWRVLGLIAVSCVTLACGARATECPGNPGALGTSRVLTIDPSEFPRIGTVQYPKSLPLQDKEVVLTFDDGPMPPYTNRVLEVLAEQCVRANYFIIGRMARGYPELLRQIRAASHVIGTHSQNHPLAFERMAVNAVQGEVDQGIASVAAALNDRSAVAPFFRIPGLLRAPHVESILQSRGLVAWSADVVADDWKHISAAEVVRRSMARLEEKGKGILLLHDIQPATALALPELLRQLKAHGYRIVQVVPAGRGAPPPVVAKIETPAAKPEPPARAEAPITRPEPPAAKPTAPTAAALARKNPDSEAPPVPPVAVQRTAPTPPPTPAAAAERAVAAPPTPPAVAERPAPISPPSVVERTAPAQPPRLVTLVPPHPAASPAEPEDDDEARPSTSARILTIPQPVEPAPVAQAAREELTSERIPRSETPVMAAADDSREAAAETHVATTEPPAAPTPPPVRRAEPDPSIPPEPVRPYAATMKPAQSATVPGKLMTPDPGGLRGAVTVPVTRAGGVGVSSIVRSQSQDGRFQDNR
jgi:peptidoglycan-N-acetylglucosamine deacetylase